MAIKVSNSDLTATLNFKCRKGDTFERFLAFSTNGAPEDLTGHSFKLQVRDKKTSSLKLEFTMSTGASISGNTLRLFKDADDMNAVVSGEHKYDLEDLYPDGTVITRIEGDFIVNADTTY